MATKQTNNKQGLGSGQGGDSKVSRIWYYRLPSAVLRAWAGVAPTVHPASEAPSTQIAGSHRGLCWIWEVSQQCSNTFIVCCRGHVYVLLRGPIGVPTAHQTGGIPRPRAGNPLGWQQILWRLWLTRGTMEGRGGIWDSRDRTRQPSRGEVSPRGPYAKLHHREMDDG